MGCRGLVAEVGPCWVTGLQAAPPGGLSIVVAPRQPQAAERRPDVAAPQKPQPKKAKLQAKEEGQRWGKGQDQRQQADQPKQQGEPTNVPSAPLPPKAAGAASGGKPGGSSRSGARRRPRGAVGAKAAGGKGFSPLDLLAAAAAASRTASGAATPAGEAPGGGALLPAAPGVQAVAGAPAQEPGAAPRPAEGAAAAAPAGPEAATAAAAEGRVAVSAGTGPDLAFLAQLGGCFDRGLGL
jgi:hypothetical protein